MSESEIHIRASPFSSGAAQIPIDLWAVLW